MPHFADTLSAAITAKGTPICVGLDPNMDAIPHCVRALFNNDEQGQAEAVSHFFAEIIDAVADLVPVVKPQIAFFEALGTPGMEAYRRVCAYASAAGLLVISDAKRNDIGSTAEAYAEAHLGEEAFPVNALTVTPFLGSDGILPFVKRCEKNDRGIFVLVKTSNPSSGEFQDLRLESGEPLYERIAASVAEWGKSTVGDCGFSSVGAVVGATYPAQAARLRELMPQQFFLVPGYGAQGAGAADVRPCFTADGRGAIVNSSRGILYAYQKSDYPEEEFAAAARDAVLKMKIDLASF